MIGRTVGKSFAAARDFIARGVLRIGVSPNSLTLVGMVLTTGAGVCYAIGSQSGFALSLNPSASSNAYLLLGGLLLLAASGCDMLDGAVARIGGKSTPFGAFLDSSLDRFSDFAVYAGIALCYSWSNPANVTFVFLAMLSFFNAFMISYTRARAEDLIDHCRVGYWQRGERSVAILLGTFAYNTPALLVQQAVFPALTVLRRVRYTRAALEKRSPITDPRQGGFWLKIRVWRYPRMSVPYDMVTFLNVAWLVLVPVPPLDVIRRWIAG